MRTVNRVGTPMCSECPHHHGLVRWRIWAIGSYDPCSIDFLKRISFASIAYGVKSLLRYSPSLLTDPCSAHFQT